MVPFELLTLRTLECSAQARPGGRAQPAQGNAAAAAVSPVFCIYTYTLSVRIKVQRTFTTGLVILASMLKHSVTFLRDEMYI